LNTAKDWKFHLAKIARPAGTLQHLNSGTPPARSLSMPTSSSSWQLVLEEMRIIAGTVTISHQPRLKKHSTRAASGAHNQWQSKYVYLIGAKMWMPVRRNTSTFGFGHESRTVLYLPVYTVNKVKNVTFSEQANGEKIAVLSCTEGPAAPDFELPI